MEKVITSASQAQPSALPKSPGSADDSFLSFAAKEGLIPGPKGTSEPSDLPNPASVNSLQSQPKAQVPGGVKIDSQQSAMSSVLNKEAGVGEPKQYAEGDAQALGQAATLPAVDYRDVGALTGALSTPIALASLATPPGLLATALGTMIMSYMGRRLGDVADQAAGKAPESALGSMGRASLDGAMAGAGEKLASMMAKGAVTADDIAALFKDTAT